MVVLLRGAVRYLSSASATTEKTHKTGIVRAKCEPFGTSSSTSENYCVSVASVYCKAATAFAYK